MTWCGKKIDTDDFNDLKLSLNILSNEATIESFKGQLKLNRDETANCYLIVISDDTNKKTLFRKLVVPKIIADDLSVLKEGKIFVIPIE
jgi:hypothetical protein